MTITINLRVALFRSSISICIYYVHSIPSNFISLHLTVAPEYVPSVLIAFASIQSISIRYLIGITCIMLDCQPAPVCHQYNSYFTIGKLSIIFPSSLGVRVESVIVTVSAAPRIITGYLASRSEPDITNFEPE